MEFVTARLVHEEFKRKEKEPHGNDSVMVSRQGKGSTSNTKNEPRVYFICGKSGHIACHCWHKKDNVKNNANNAKVEDVKKDHLFVVGVGACNTSMHKWLIDSGVIQHMTSHSKHLFLMNPFHTERCIWVTMEWWRPLARAPCL